MEIRGFKSNVLFKRNLNKFRLVCLVLLSEVLGVKVFLLAPTASGDGARERFCVSLSPSPPRTLKTLDEFVEKTVLLKKKFLEPSVNLRHSTRKSRWSRVETSKIILDFYPVICLVRWIMGRIGKVGREVMKKTWLSVTIKLKLPWLSRSMILP